MPDTDQTMQGLLITAVASLAGVIAIVFRILYKRFFDNGEGLIPLVVKRHIQFIDQTATLNQNICDNTESTANAVGEMSAALASFVKTHDQEAISTVRTNRVLLEIAQVADELVDPNLNDDQRQSTVHKHTARIREILRKIPTLPD